LLRSNSVTIWSAGCATGEEPYSLAILAHKVLNIHAANHRVSIIASDIDKDALAKAEKGEYLKKQLNGSTDSFIEKYFIKQGELYRVRDFVKQFVHFEQFDLMNPSSRNNLDLILCRNVMIYFSKEGQQHIHMNFYRALRAEGFFITGKAEMLTGEPSQKFMSVDVTCRVYQKPKLESTLKAGLLSQSTSSNFIQNF
jgi:chemotaxis protein methyltransferase CheR